MGVPQMYYTSCEAGLAGYPGFQFNAATPGVDPGVLRRVEQATSYEPPRSLGYQPTAEQIAACPVNLCYQPGADGEPAILAHTVFVGTDYSQRFGNYFVHALSLDPDGDELGGTLPIDFWRADFWARHETSRTALPELRPVPSRSGGAGLSEAFLDRSGRRGWLPRLLTAVERALVAGERSVILVDADSERTARWIATVCHLLPPQMSRRLSFATYSFRPGRNREHLVATVPETDFVADESALRGYYVFDFVGGNASELDSHPLAELLAEIDVDEGEQLWALAEPLAAGDEEDFAGWYPVAVAGALRGGTVIDRHDLAAVVDWLPRRVAALRPVLAAQVVYRCLEHEALTGPMCASLARVAAALDDEQLLENAEVKAFTMLLDDPGGEVADVPRPVTPHGIRNATGLVTAALDEGRSLYPLTVAARAELALDRADLERWGRERVAPALLAGPDASLTEPLRKLPDLRRGVLSAFVAALAGREPQVVAAIDRLGDAVPENEFTGYPQLQRAVLLARAARDPAQRLPALLRVCGSAVPDQATLATLWPAEWTTTEAAEIAARSPERFWSSPAMVERLDQVLRRPAGPDPGATWDSYFDLCNLVQDRRLRLSVRSEGYVSDLRRALKLMQKKSADSLRTLLDELPRLDGPARRCVEDKLPKVLAGLAAASTLAAVLPRVPDEMRFDYRELLTRRLTAKVADIDLAAVIFEARAQLGKHREPIAELDRVLAGTVARWRPRDLDQLEKWLAGSTVRGAAGYFEKWRDEAVPRGLSRLLPRWRH